MMNIKDVVRWSDMDLLHEYESRRDLRGQMVGWLYPSIVEYEQKEILREAERRHGCHVSWFREKGIVPASWTDDFGVVHGIRNCPGRKPGMQPDKEPQPITCLACAAFAR